MRVSETFGIRALSGQILAFDRPADQGDGLAEPIEHEERAHAGPVGLAEEYLVKRPEPGLQVAEGMALADLVDLRLDVLGAGPGG